MHTVRTGCKDGICGVTATPILQLLICIIGVSVLLYAHVTVFICVCRAYNHPGVAGKWWAPVQTVQKTLVTAPQTTCSLVR